MRVTLIGAGPGDAGLLTMKGAERLKQAKVVLYDRLVSADVLAMIPQGVEKIDVGKRADNHPVPQDAINKLLLTKAREGREVVRLKGGDPFVFGRGGEELELLAENGIPFEVIPGVSSSIAGPAYAGVPVTHRDFVSSVHIITGHARAGQSVQIDFDALVRLKGTLVFMMSVESLPEICGGLARAGMDGETPAAIVENATTAKQRSFVGSIRTLPEVAVENGVESPAVIVVGQVCGLAERFAWFGQAPLFGKTVVVTRARAGASEMSRRLRELGCNVIEAPCIRTEKTPEALQEILARIQDFHWLGFTSAVGVDVFFDYLLEIGFDIRRLYRLKLAAVGSETEKAIRKRGLIVDYVPEEYHGAALARGLAERMDAGERLLVARAKDGAEEVAEILTKAGILFEEAAVYETFFESPFEGETNMRKRLEAADCVAFASSSAVEGFVKAFAEMDYSRILAVCIGERTAASARKYGMDVEISEKATIESLIQRIKERMTHGK